VEFWLYREPCPVFVRANSGSGVTPTRELLGQIDAMLGSAPR
jgi:hypothetical protein